MVIFNDPVPVENPALQAVLMERYDTLAAPIVVITGDRDTVVSPGHHAMRLAARCPALEWRCFPVSAICCTTPPSTGSSQRRLR
jgi:pimeloyl-ACP methyl ester carboxylesterase